MLFSFPKSVVRFISAILVFGLMVRFCHYVLRASMGGLLPSIWRSATPENKIALSNAFQSLAGIGTCSRRCRPTVRAVVDYLWRALRTTPCDVEKPTPCPCDIALRDAWRRNGTGLTTDFS